MLSGLISFTAHSMIDVPANYKLLREPTDSATYTSECRTEENRSDNSLYFYIQNDVSKNIYREIVLCPNKNLNLHGLEKDKKFLIANQIAKKLNLKTSVSPWRLIDSNISCGSNVNSKFTVQSNIDGSVKEILVQDACRKINFQNGKRDGLVMSQLITDGYLGEQPTYENCDVVLNESNIGTLSAKIANNNSDSSADLQVCFEPGRYNKIHIDRKYNIIFSAPYGGVYFSDVVETKSDNQNTDGAIFSITNSKNISLFQLFLENKYEYQGTSLQQLSRSLNIHNSENVSFTDGTIKSLGKQTISTNNSTFYSKNSDIYCFYFCISANTSKIKSNRDTYHQKHETKLGDSHSLFYTLNSNLILSDATFNLYSGAGIFSGTSSPIGNDLIIKGTTSIQDKGSNGLAWIQTHPNYWGLTLSISGEYTAIDDYYENNYQGGGRSFGMRIKR